MIEKDSNYVYFFHGTGVIDEKSFFDNGLVNYRGADIKSTMWPYSEEIMGDDLSEAVKGYAHKWGFANVVVVKMPFRIWEAWDRNGNPYIPLPIWRYDGEKDNYGRKKATLIPQLIAGMYKHDLETGEESFVENPNYSTDINPNGLQYDEEQIQFFRDYIYGEWAQFAYDRSKHTYDELLKSDLQTRPFDGLIDLYRQKGIIQGKDIENVAEKQSLSGIRSTWEKFKNWINRTFKSQPKYLNDGHQNDSQERID